MTVEAAHHTTASYEGVKNSTLRTPQEIFQSAEQRAVEYKLPLQADINARLLHLFGPDFTPSIARRALRERGRRLSSVVSNVPEIKMNSGALSQETRDEIGARTSCVRITAGLLAVRYGIDLNHRIEKKLLNKMQVKYRPDDVMEIIQYGTPEEPGEKSGLATFSYLKQNYDEETETQSYRFRGLPISKIEEDFRIPKTKFNGLYQDLTNWWQVRALGSRLVVADRFVNLLAEDGEIEEALGVLDEMSSDEIDSLSWSKPEDHWILNDLGDELADVFISSWCADSAVDTDSEKMDEERMDIAVRKYKDGPKLRKAKHDFNVRMSHMDERFKRELKGRKPPQSLGTTVWESASSFS